MFNQQQKAIFKHVLTTIVCFSKETNSLFFNERGTKLLFFFMERTKQ